MQFTRQLSLSMCLGASIVGTAGTSSAHAVLTTPLARNNRSDLKDPDGPCGKVPRTSMSTPYSSGQTLNVEWTETINHPGCFLIDLSTSGDQNWMLLKNVAHSNVGTTARNYTTQLTLPAGVSCTDCTLRLRQIMLGADTDPCPPDPIAMGATYYSCADVAISAPPAPPAPDMAQSPMPEGGAMETGCSLATLRSGLPSSTAGVGIFVALALLRRVLRRRRAPEYPFFSHPVSNWEST